MLKVVEIFKSIDGEGIRAGYPATFVRLYGCSLRCSFCDTKYSYDNDKYINMTIDEIIKEISDYKSRRITLTGGEPLYQPEAADLIHKLLEQGFEVNIETNGSIDLEEFLGADSFHENLIITMDWKSISSNMSQHMVVSNLYNLRKQDVLKFVVGDGQDLDQMRDIISSKPLKCNIFVSPVFGKIEPREIVEYILDNNLEDVRIQLQLHKIIWPADMRGV